MNRKVGCDFPKPQEKAKPEGALGIGMRSAICPFLFFGFFFCHLLLQLRSLSHTLLAATIFFSFPFLSSWRVLYLSEYQLGFHNGDNVPFLSLLCISVEEGMWLDASAPCANPGAQAPLILLLYVLFSDLSVIAMWPWESLWFLFSKIIIIINLALPCPSQEGF